MANREASGDFTTIESNKIRKEVARNLSVKVTLADRVRALQVEGKTAQQIIEITRNEIPRSMSKSKHAAYVRSVFSRTLKAEQKLKQEAQTEAQKLEQASPLTDEPNEIVKDDGGSIFENVRSEAPPFSFDTAPPIDSAPTEIISQQQANDMVLFDAQDWIDLIADFNEKLAKRKEEWALTKAELKLISIGIRKSYQKRVANATFDSMKEGDMWTIVLAEIALTRIGFWLFDNWEVIADRFKEFFKKRNENSQLPPAYQQQEASKNGTN